MRNSDSAGINQKKQKRITARLVRGTALILFLTILIPFLAYNNMPDWAFYLTSATRLWIAVDEIAGAYKTDHFLDTLKDIEKGYDSNIELYSADNRFIYSTIGLITYLPSELSAAPTIDENYRLDYETTDGSITAGPKGFLIKEYKSENIAVDFLVCYTYLPGGERIEVCMQVSQVSATAKIDFIVSFVVIMFALMLSLIFITIYMRRLTRPIQNICNITDKMSKLDFSEKCPPTKLTEITQLSDSINEMSSALDTALRDINEKNEKLLLDIENERTIDNLRQTFISGISHELKTPIAIIQGYAEGAKMFYEAGNAEAADNYCSVIMDEATRMNSMIMKLLEITKYDSGAYEPIREDFNICEMIADWIDRNSSITAEKGICVKNSVDAAFIGNGDKIILASVVNNYFSNAVSHVSGEKIIEASAEEREGVYRVYIFNTGENIAQKDIDKIWTSFYRADKSLARSQGRFGLGLAIVSSIQRLHHEDFGVENVENGVRFWFDIKKSAAPENETAAKE